MNIIKKRFTIIILFFLFISVASIILNNPIRQTDESTLFGEVLKMYNGYSIYREINVLVTPLFFYIGLLFFKIFTANYLVFRIYGILIWCLLILSIYLLLKKIKIKNTYICIALMINILFLRDIITVGANYNILAITFCIFGMNHQISSKLKERNFYIIQGIFTFLIFAIKQTIGIYYFLGFVISDIIVNKKIEVKKYLLLIMTVLLLSFIGMTILFAQHSLYAFWDYTVLGMIEFQQNLTVETYIIGLVIINIIIAGVKIYKNKEDNILKILFIYSLIMLLIAYPIICDFHSRIAMIFSILCFTYCISQDKYIKFKYLEIAIICVIVSYLMFLTIDNFITWINNPGYCKQDRYFGAVNDDRIDERIRIITEYINGSPKKVVLISPEATLYNARLDINNGILDLPLKGNTGLNGKEKIIRAIENLGDVRIMITNYTYYQEYPEIHNYIMNHYNKVDTVIGIFEVYEKK